MREVEEGAPGSDNPIPCLPPGGSPISGILKGGRLWKQPSLDVNTARALELQQVRESYHPN